MSQSSRTNKQFGSLQVSTTILTGSVVKSQTSISTTSNAVTSANSGTAFFLNSASGSAISLPLPTSGFSCDFVVGTAPSSGNYILSSGSANIYGAIVQPGNTSSSNVTSTSGGPTATVQLISGQAKIGDYVFIKSDGTNFYASGFATGSGAKFL